jgi:hypothetical protein
MPIGFYDDPSFRWAANPTVNLKAAANEHATIIHALVSWNQVAKTRPANPLNGNDPAYHLSDIDALVETAGRYGFQVLLTITGTPTWANGGQTPNHPPSNLETLTQFAQMLATRYNGQHSHGLVTDFSVWNEPNLALFLVPQFQGSTIVSPAIYARLYMAAYTGIKRGNPEAVVAAGETSNRGRSTPASVPGEDAVAPALFAEDVAKAAPHLPFAAWATHPYPELPNQSPTERVAFPNVAFSTMSQFGASLAKWFKRPVPIWITEYAEQTKPQYSLGVSYAAQAADARKALKLAQANPYVQMFIWFVFRDSTSATWFSGLETASGAPKPALATFRAVAAGMSGQTESVTPGKTFSVSVSLPSLYYAVGGGARISIHYALRAGGATSGKTLASGTSTETIQRESAMVTVPIKFKPKAGSSYTITIGATDRYGGVESPMPVVALASAGTPSPAG